MSSEWRSAVSLRMGFDKESLKALARRRDAEREVTTYDALPPAFLPFLS
jgi:hypothetical protein